MKKAFLLISVCFVLISAITIILNKKSSNKTETVVELISNDQNQEENIQEINEEISNLKYQEGFARGYNRYLAQIGKESEFKEQKYTNNIENISEEQKEALEAAEIKGYIDGYHKAGDMEFCPRNHY